MTPEKIFSLANLVTLVSWALLILARFIAPLRRWIDPLAGYVVPALFAVVYAALMLPGALDVLSHNSFGSLAGVMALFAQPMALTGGWIHYLAFDLFVGGWIARDSAAAKVHPLIVLPILLLTFMFGPVGFLAYVLVRAVQRKGAPQ